MGKELVVKMPKELDHHQAKELGQALDYKIREEAVRHLVFDFECTEFMDSSGIGVLIGRSRTMNCYNGTVAAKNIGKRVRRILMASGMDQLIRMEETK